VRSFISYLKQVKTVGTADVYGRAANLLAQYVQETKIPIHQSPGLLFGFVNWLLRTREIKPKSLQTYIPGAKKYLEWRRAMGDPLPVFASPDLPKVKRNPPEALRSAGLAAFRRLSESRNEPFRTAALLFPLSGLRTMECCSLPLAKIARDPSDSTGRRLMLKNVEGKSKELRDIPLPDPGSAILYAYLTGWRARVPVRTPWLFPSEKDPMKHYNDGTLRAKMNVIEQQLGIGRLEPRILRHTWATAMADGGLPLHHLAQVAGHQSIQTTYKNYIAPAEAATLGAEIAELDFYPGDDK